MSEENNSPVTETTKPLLKKENTLPVVAIAISGVALIASLFTVSVASAQPNHAPDRQFSNSQEMPQQHEEKQRNFDSEEKGQERHGERERKGQDSQQMPQQDRQQSAPQQQQMPKMNGQTGAS